MRRWKPLEERLAGLEQAFPSNKALFDRLATIQALATRRGSESAGLRAESAPARNNGVPPAPTSWTRRLVRARCLLLTCWNSVETVSVAMLVLCWNNGSDSATRGQVGQGREQQRELEAKQVQVCVPRA